MCLGHKCQLAPNAGSNQNTDQLCSKEEEMSKSRAVILTDLPFWKWLQERYVTLPFNSDATNLNLNVELPRYNFMTLGNKIIPGRLQIAWQKTLLLPPHFLYLLEHLQTFLLKHHGS